MSSSLFINRAIDLFYQQDSVFLILPLSNTVSLPHLLFRSQDQQSTINYLIERINFSFPRLRNKRNLLSRPLSLYPYIVCTLFEKVLKNRHWTAIRLLAYNFFMMRIRERYLLVTAQIADARHIEAVCRHVKRLVSRHQKSSSSSLSLETVIASALTHRDHCPGLNTTKSLGLDLNTAPMSDATLDKSVVIVKHKENSRNLRVSAEISLSLWRARV